MAFTNDGRLYGASGKEGSATSNRLYAIDKITAVTTEIGPITSQKDYEAIACPLANVPLPPPNISLTVPRVESFAIDGEAAATAGLVVNLDAAAFSATQADARWMLFVEYAYNQELARWEAARPSSVQSSDWSSYATAARSTWRLAPGAGVKRLQAWAADGAGRISTFPYQAFINYIPPADTLAQGQVRVFRYSLRVGERLTARVATAAGDADLYVWPQDADALPWASNLGDGPDEVSIEAPVDGIYQVEVHGYVATEYQLTIDIGAGMNTERAARPEGGVDSSKPQPRQPLVPLDSAPNIRQAALAGPPIDRGIYLPIIHFRH